MSQSPPPRSERSTAPSPSSRGDRTAIPSRIAAAAVAALLAGPAAAAAPPAAPATGVTATPAVTIPDFWNPRSRGERVEAPQTGRAVRFLTDDEFPPLHFAGPDGNPTGFVVELARAVCEKLTITCTVQARRFDTLLDALDGKQGDVVAAAIPLTASLRSRFLATRPYFRWPARFAARTDKGLPVPSAAALAGRSVGVIAGSAHAAYLKAFFPKAVPKDFTDLTAAESALKRGEIDYLFADGLNLALFVGGQDAESCCALTGGDYLENRYFGEGIGLITRQEDAALSRALDDALQRVWDDGKYTELYLRFFPVSPF
ncbi:amino acid ABC transporter substrate-binding protein, PAAT family [Methylobacterium sp. UNC300MFChir4.1]|uniref:transporter substrate-binding domain-containing protein n=1 Tax=Methylobacterium sp. UNC300MFChir4.1 TaxID=1502747 RepID=UPI0008C72140|nr:transporter substrate-binding domain-containing protein [Methylobacterium sp. UNC300MFChir4.1]SEO29616.1 amino acid ABC transporter substrate-binding protein, PAAT family [Methylobacterium sp. UNC300MFChir4.1]